jgi:hypothetical protein
MTNKIDINKQYKTRSGLPVRIYSVDGGGGYSIHGAYLSDDGWNIESWDNDGNCYDDIGLDDLDLIEVGKYDHIKIDDKVLVWTNGEEYNKRKCHFAGLSSDGKNRPCVWDGRRTSFTEGNRVVFDNCELYIGE